MNISDKEFQKFHMPKKCKYCSGFAEYKPLEQFEHHSVNVYFCQPCLTEYLYFADGELFSIWLYTFINEKMYRWSPKFKKVSFIKEPGIPGEKMNHGVVDLISSMEIDSNSINPSNINEKIKNWLMFI